MLICSTKFLIPSQLFKSVIKFFIAFIYFSNFLSLFSGIAIGFGFPSCSDCCCSGSPCGPDITGSPGIIGCCCIIGSGCPGIIGGGCPGIIGGGCIIGSCCPGIIGGGSPGIIGGGCPGIIGIGCIIGGGCIIGIGCPGCTGISDITGCGCIIGIGSPGSPCCPDITGCPDSPDSPDSSCFPPINLFSLFLRELPPFILF